MKIVWAFHARQCFSMLPKCTQTKNIWQTVVSQLIKVFLLGTEKHLVNCCESVPTEVFHPLPSTKFKPEYKYDSKTCSFWNTRQEYVWTTFFQPWATWWVERPDKELDESCYTESQLKSLSLVSKKWNALKYFFPKHRSNKGTLA